MAENILDLNAVSQQFRALALAMGWQAYHTPKNLAAAISVEAAELLEIFQWLTDEQANDVEENEIEKIKVADEAADIVMYVVELCGRLKIDLPEAIENKVKKNEARYSQRGTSPIQKN